MYFLTFNAGSSSIKIGYYFVDEKEEAFLFSGKITGEVKKTIEIIKKDGTTLLKEEVKDGVDSFFNWLKTYDTNFKLDGILHRLVQGGPKLRKPSFINQDVMETLQSYASYDPEHLPEEIKIISLCQKRYPHLPEIACFDTAFFQDLPLLSKRFPLPETFFSEGVFRYGFHGLSYEYILKYLQKNYPEESKKRLIIAHLGSGASMAAVIDGKPFDTTMGFSPIGGLMMGSRTGDLDPGIFLYLLEKKKMKKEEIRSLFYHESGLLGVSEETKDMQTLLKEMNKNPKAKLAVDLFCYQAKKWIGALSFAMSGLDCLIFTGGIGENAKEVRKKICENMDFFQIDLDEEKNSSNSEKISTGKSKVSLFTFKTHEEKVMVRHGFQYLKENL